MTARRPSLLRDLSDGVLDLHDLARRDQIPRLKLARWACKPRHAAALDELARLAEKRTSLLLATGRSEAALMLVSIARGQVSDIKETSRKACLDLLKIEPPSPEPSLPACEKTQALTGEPTETEMRLATEALARYAEQRDQDDAASGAD
jgi:hypothetical protein